MSNKYFIHLDDEMCGNIEHVKDFMRTNNMVSLDVFEAKRDIGSDFFFCKDAWEVGEKGECGVVCSAYKPRNGKNGICIHNAPVYEHGNKVTIHQAKSLTPEEVKAGRSNAYKYLEI